jgi:hypothetical protein
MNLKISLSLVPVIAALILPYGNSFSQQPADQKASEKKYESLYNSLNRKVEAERLKKGVFYLSKDPLPRRVLNYTIPGHKLSTLEEADAWIIQQLKNNGYKPVTDSTRVHAFGRDLTKPLPRQYAPPAPDAPWYTARNIIADLKGTKYPDDLIVIIAHKDSQSWIPSPGANDDAIGACAALELATVLQKYRPEHTIRFIFCNEEHQPWTSITAAKEIKASGKDVLALINVDGVGVKGPQPDGKFLNVTRYASDEGARLAAMMTRLNKRHAIGLVQSEQRSERPGDDDGSFINAGFPWSIRNAGSIPNSHPGYHTEADTWETVDFENAAAAIKLTLAGILWLDLFGRP